MEYIKNKNIPSNLFCGRKIPHRLKLILTEVLQLSLLFTFTSALLYFVLLNRTDLTLWVAIGISSSLSLILTIFIRLFPTFRCIMALALVKIVCPESRILILSVITGIVIGGPVVSIAFNLHEIQQTAQCTSELVKTQALQLNETYTAAFDAVSSQIANSIQVWEDLGSKVEKALEPFREGLSKVSDSIGKVQIDISRVNDKCTSTIQTAQTQCKEGTQQAFQECLELLKTVPDIVEIPSNILSQAENIMDKLPFGIGRRRRSISDVNKETICGPIKVGESACPGLRSEVICSPINVASIPTFTEVQELLQNTLKTFDFSVNPRKVLSINETSSFHNLTEVYEKISDDIQETFSQINVILQIIQMSLSIPMILIPIPSAYFYLRRYRKAAGTQSSSEITKFFTKDGKKEKSGIILQIGFILTHILLTGVVIAFDILLHWTQNVVQKHGGANLTAQGAVNIGFDVKAGPIFQPVVDRFVNILEHEQSYEFQLSSSNCLPHPTEPKSKNTEMILLISVLYTTIIVAVLSQFFIVSLKKKVIRKFDHTFKAGSGNSVNHTTSK